MKNLLPKLGRIFQAGEEQIEQAEAND